jgi:hypothetical protein
MKTDKEILEANAHITDAEVLADIYDTEMEISRRVRLNYDEEGVKERRDFVLKLRHLLELREAHGSNVN